MRILVKDNLFLIIYMKKKLEFIGKFEHKKKLLQFIYIFY